VDLIELWDYLRERGEEIPPADEFPVLDPDEDAHPVQLRVPRIEPADRERFAEEPAAIWLSDNDLPSLPEGLRIGDTVPRRPDQIDVLGTPWESSLHACAWYRQIAFNGPSFGIFIRQECMLDLARAMAPFVFAPGTRLSLGHIDLLVRLAFNYLYLHEQFHHKVESLAIRLAVADRRAIYSPYWFRVYAPSRGTDDLLEEALANADAFHRFAEPRYATFGAPAWMSPVDGVRDFLRAHFRGAPAGYRMARNYLTGATFASGQDTLSAMVADAVSPVRPDWPRWEFAPQMLRGLFPITSSIWVVVKPPARVVVPTTAAPLSVSTREVEDLLPRLRYRKVPGEGKGSHQKWEPISGAGGSVEIPRDRDIPKGTLNGIAKDLGFANGHQLAMACRSKGRIASS
jgi:predicted RNA binding protein YcfA (HicA-like mRNA interferase family)